MAQKYKTLRLLETRSTTKKQKYDKINGFCLYIRQLVDDMPFCDMHPANSLDRKVDVTYSTVPH